MESLVNILNSWEPLLCPFMFDFCAFMELLTSLIILRYWNLDSCWDVLGCWVLCSCWLLFICWGRLSCWVGFGYCVISDTFALSIYLALLSLSISRSYLVARTCSPLTILSAFSVSDTNFRNFMKYSSNANFEWGVLSWCILATSCFSSFTFSKIFSLCLSFYTIDSWLYSLIIVKSRFSWDRLINIRILLGCSLFPYKYSFPSYIWNWGTQLG